MRKKRLKKVFSQFEIYTGCNNDCEGCEVPKTTTHEIIPFEIAARAVDDLAEAGIQILEFIGGEPYAYPHMLNLIKHIFNNRPEIQRFAILTNALDRQALEKTKPFLSKNRGGIVLSINYTKEQCNQLLKQNIDVGMAKKSLAAWEVLDGDILDHGWVRINCVINDLNIETFPEIGEDVIKRGVLFSVCPFVYQRKNFPSTVNLTFRSKEVGHAPTEKHKKLMQEAVQRLLDLKNSYPEQVIPSREYINYLPETCKNPEEPYSISCKGLGLPYLRVSSHVARSKIDGTLSPRIRACTDIAGEGGLLFELVTSDLRYPWIIYGLDDLYNLNPEVLACIRDQCCPWSVTFALCSQGIK